MVNERIYTVAVMATEYNATEIMIRTWSAVLGRSSVLHATLDILSLVGEPRKLQQVSLQQRKLKRTEKAFPKSLK